MDATEESYRLAVHELTVAFTRLGKVKTTEEALLIAQTVGRTGRDSRSPEAPIFRACIYLPAPSRNKHTKPEPIAESCQEGRSKGRPLRPGRRRG